MSFLVSQTPAGLRTPLLRGRRIGLVCERDDSSAARLFRSAASALGAQIVHVPAPTPAEAADASRLAAIARLLGRLYDALECQDLPAPLVQTLARLATVPVFAGTAGEDEPRDAAAIQARLLAALM